MHVVDMEAGGSRGELNDGAASSSKGQSIDTRAARDVAEENDVHMKDVVKLETKSPPAARARRGRRRRGRGGVTGGQITLTRFMARSRRSQEGQPQTNGAVKESPDDKENVDEDAATKKPKTESEEPAKYT